MLLRSTLILTVFLACASCAFAEEADQTAAISYFESHIRPALIQHCYECHSGDRAEGGLRLDFRGGWEKGGDSGPSVVPNKPGESLLVLRLRETDDSLAMPKDKPQLSEEVIKAFEQWIAQGAVDPRIDPPSADEVSRLAWESQFIERKKWWSLQPLQAPAVPAVTDAAWPVNDIDRFILAKLEAANLKPGAISDRATLARRLSFVLTGLPPSIEEVNTFVSDNQPGAYERLVDHFLNSPHFGEHWARHWMDVVRYSDTYGYEWDVPAKGAWRYRDYLIRAFNQDLPFDQLVREQIAGDLLPQPRINSIEQINESLIGPMFFQMGEKRHGDSADFDGIHQEMVNNKIDAFSKAFLATTVACARCHDHKLDAVSQRDYYALAGVFISSRWVSNTLDTEDRNQAIIENLRALKPQIRAAVGPMWKADALSFPKYLEAAQASVDGKPLPETETSALNSSRLEAWRKLLAVPADKTPAMEDPLSPWIELSRATAKGAQIPTTWQELATKYATAQQQRQQQNAAQFHLIADFRQGIPPGWSVEGVGLRGGPSRCGDFSVALEGANAIGVVVPGGLYTHLLSPRLNGAVRTPYLNTLAGNFLSVEAAGGQFAAHRTVVDNAFLTERQAYLTQSQPSWQKFSTFPAMKQRHIYVEFATKASNPNFPPRWGLGASLTPADIEDPRSWLGVTRVFTHEVDGAPADELSRFPALFTGDAPTTTIQAADRYGAWLSSAIDRWARDEATEDDVRLVNWMLEQGLLTNSSELPENEALNQLIRTYRETERQLANPESVNGMADIDPGYDYRLNIRGVYDNLGDPVPRGGMSVLPSEPTSTAPSSSSSGSRRLELAEETASPHNPLTPRVYVNRVWHWVYGTGIVATTDDFGRLGDPPSHPELLDHLASWFITHNWSTKELVRMMVLSQTFRQASDVSASGREIDPRNRLLHHYPLRRLEAESIRDSLLAVSGRLEPALYGAPLDPPRSNEDAMKRLFNGPLDGLGRRSIYTKMTIMEPPKFLATFNQPSPKIPTGRRDVTNVPAQSLAMLNDPLVGAQSDYWAKQLISMNHADPAQRITYMFEESVSRKPSQEELDLWVSLVNDLTKLHNAGNDVMHAEIVWRDVAHAIFNMKEFIYLR